MCQRTIFSRSCTRLAEQLQLLAEEEWIVSALKNLKHQRNCLQIEKLHLESLKAKMSDPSKSSEKKKEFEDLVSAVNMMKNPGLSRDMNMSNESELATTAEDALCNVEELNLMVQQDPGLRKPMPQYCFNNMEEEEEEEEDEEESDNIVVDMNMLMNGNCEWKNV